MKNFKDFGIEAIKKPFAGDKINIEKLLNREIKVIAFRIEPSTKKPGTEFLTLSFTLNDEPHIIFSGSKNLMEQISRVPADGFPFKTTIIKDSNCLQFS